MKILGIETSCDETAAAVVENGVHVMSNIIASQVPLHQQTGGVVPEVAAREHVLKMIPVIEQALKEAKVQLRDIDAIAATQGPGLLSSLIIGTCTASALALSCRKPLIGVNHIAGHIYANWLNRDADAIPFPAIILTASGGHNELVLMKAHAKFTLLGETLDDAAGEAFDKVARLLGLGYPGGPQVARAAHAGNPNRYAFPKAYMHEQSHDFSFSGLKTAVLNLVKAEHTVNGLLSEEFISDCAASFQDAVCEILSDKLLRAVKMHNAKSALLSGGVSANQRLREIIGNKISHGYFFDHKGRKQNIGRKPEFYFPSDYSFCTDNAAMIAGSAFFSHTFGKGKTAVYGRSLLADPNLSLYYSRER